MNFAPTDEQKMVREMVRKYSESRIKPLAAELDRTHRHPEEICRELGEMGIMGVAVPTAYDGAGMDNVTYVMALIEISKACASCGVIVSVNNSLYGYPVNTFGTEEQKCKYLAPVAGGKVEGCYALTESSAGSDAAALKCRAELRGDNYIVNGAKTFITSGNLARYCVLAATTDPAAGYKGIINLIVDLKETPGFKVGKVEEKMGILASGTAELVFEEAEVPAENLLGKPGQGFRQMLSGLDAAELMLLRAAWLEDNGIDFEKEAAMAKYYASDVAMRAAIEGVQIFGGYGYIKEYPAERHMRDAKICQIYEGTNEIQRVVVARKLIGLR